MHKVSTPITFTTEAERLRAREQYVRICHAADIANESMRIGDWYYESLFDRAFPPIAPPKMVPFELNAQVDNEGRCIELGYVYKSTAIDPKTTRETRVRVTEIDDE